MRADHNWEDKPAGTYVVHGRFDFSEDLGTALGEIFIAYIGAQKVSCDSTINTLIP